jgi:hypothetical protein
MPASTPLGVARDGQETPCGEVPLHLRSDDPLEGRRAALGRVAHAREAGRAGRPQRHRLDRCFEWPPPPRSAGTADASGWPGRAPTPLRNTSRPIRECDRFVPTESSLVGGRGSIVTAEGEPRIEMRGPSWRFSAPPSGASAFRAIYVSGLYQSDDRDRVRPLVGPLSLTSVRLCPLSWRTSPRCCSRITRRRSRRWRHD